MKAALEAELKSLAAVNFSGIRLEVGKPQGCDLTGLGLHVA